MKRKQFGKKQPKRRSSVRLIVDVHVTVTPSGNPAAKAAAISSAKR